MNVAPYRKAIVAVGVALGQLATVTADGDLTTNEAIVVVLAFLGALGVYQATNTPAAA